MGNLRVIARNMCVVLFSHQTRWFETTEEDYHDQFLWVPILLASLDVCVGREEGRAGGVGRTWRTETVLLFSLCCLAYS